MSGSEVLLVLNPDTRGAELFRDGEQVWASDSDADLVEELGTDKVERDDIGDVLDYLVDQKYMTDAEADDCPVDEGTDEDEDADADEDDEDADEWDDEDEDDEEVA